MEPHPEKRKDRTSPPVRNLKLTNMSFSGHLVAVIGLRCYIYVQMTIK